MPLQENKCILFLAKKDDDTSCPSWAEKGVMGCTQVAWIDTCITQSGKASRFMNPFVSRHSRVASLQQLFGSYLIFCISQYFIYAYNYIHIIILYMMYCHIYVTSEWQRMSTPPRLTV